MNASADRYERPSFLYFDLGNVIVDFDVGRGVRQMADVAAVPDERVRQVVFASDLQHRYEMGQIDTRQFYDAFCRETRTRPDFDALAEAGNAIFAINVRLLPIVAQLHAAGHRLGILSNTNEGHWAYCRREFGVLRTGFEHQVLSYEVGAMKPDPEIYRVARERAGVPAESIFFVDDRPENVDGAREAGFDAVQFTGPLDLAKELWRRGVEFNY